METYFLGIDAGTVSIRSSVFDSRGKNLGTASYGYETHYSGNGWAEQDDAAWFAALKKAIPESIKNAGLQPQDIKAITCDATTCTLVFLGSDGRSVRRPIPWMDVRAAEEASYIDTIRENFPAADVYKPSFRADTMIPKCMWLKKHERENWDRTVYIIEFIDWLNYMLTGRITLSLSTAAFRWNYDASAGGLPLGLYKACGVEDAADKIPSVRLRLGEKTGTVSAEAARLFGLAEGTKVYEGTADCNAGMFGVGCVKPGMTALIGGTSTCILGLTEKGFHVDGVNGTYPDAMTPGTGLAEGGQTSSGAVLSWFRDTLLPSAWEKDAARLGMNTLDYITERARTAPIGSGGLILTDYFQGNRAPYADSRARGVLMGLSLSSTAEHIARAVYEGVAYGAHHCICTMEDAGYTVHEIYACGGISSSPFWLQMHADVTGKPVITTAESRNTPGLGDAIIASVGCELYPSYEDAAKNMVCPGKIYTPDENAHREYMFYYERYKEIWPSVRQTVHKLVDKENASAK